MVADGRRCESRLRAALDFSVGAADHDPLEAGDGRDQLDVGGFDAAQSILPVGSGVWPRNQHRRLRFPFRGKAYCGCDYGQDKSRVPTTLMPEPLLAQCRA